MPTNAQALSDALDAILTSVEQSAFGELSELVLPIVGDVGDAADDGLSFLAGARQTLEQALAGVDPTADLGDALAAALNGLPLVDSAMINEEGDLRIRLAQDGDTPHGVRNLSSDFGLPGFGFNGQAGFELTTGYDFSADLIFDLDEGGLQLGMDGIDLIFDVAGDIAYSGVASLGFLALEISDVEAEEGVEDPLNGAAVEFALTFDGDILAPEIDATFGGEVGLAAHLATSSVSDFLPEFQTDFILAYDVATGIGEGGGLDAGLSELGFHDISVSLAALDDLLGGVFDRIEEITSSYPLAPVIEFFEKRVPLLDQLSALAPHLDEDGVDGVTVKDMLALYNRQLDKGLLTALDKVLDVLNTLEAIGDFASEEGFELGDAIFSEAAISAFNSGEDISALETVFASIDADALGLGAVGDLIEEAAAFATAIQDAITEGAEVEGEGSTFDVKIPLIEEGAAAAVGEILLNSIFGLPSPIVEFDLPEFDLPRDQASFVFNIPIGPFAFIIEGGLDANVSLDVGYSTYGVQQNAPSFLDGFYLGTPNGPLAQLEADLGVDFGVNYPGVRASIGGGLDGGLRLFLDDNDAAPGGGDATAIQSDGLSHISELDFPCIFQPFEGELGAGLRVTFKVGFKPFEWKKVITIAETTIADFSIGCEGHGGAEVEIENGGLATLGPDGGVTAGELRLNVGDDAVNRTPPNDLGAGVTAEAFTVTIAPQEEGDEGPAELRVGAFGVFERFALPATIFANAGSDHDTITIGAEITADATLLGGEGEDVLVGGSGDDSLDGGADDDVLSGGDGDDTLVGGGGDDVIRAGEGADRIEGGDGMDQVDYSASDVGVSLTRSGSTVFGAYGLAEGDVLTNVEYLLGSAFSDYLTGDESDDNTLEGDRGDDVLMGGDGRDYLIGGAGADVIDGRGGGADIASYITSRGGVTVNLATGLAAGAEAAGDVLTRVEQLQGSIHEDKLTGNAQANLLDGSNGDDVLEGAAGADTIIGGGGNDIIVARGDGDEIDGGGARTGMRDRDLLTYETATSGVDAALAAALAKYAADDEVLGAFAGPDATERSNVFGSVEDLRGSAHNDRLTGDYGRNRIEGGDGVDQIDGSAGDDTLVGGGGADMIEGGHGVDLADYSTSGGGVTVELGGGPGQFADAEGDVLTGVENLRGSRFGDSLTGDDGDNWIDPGLGLDTVVGGDGEDTLYVNYSGIEPVAGVIGGLPDQAIGDGFIEFFNGAGPFASAVEFEGIENFHILGTWRGDLLRVGDGDDRIYSGGGDDFVDAGDGRDIVLTDDGNDIVLAKLTAAEGEDANGGAFFVFDGGDGIDGISIDLSNAPNAVDFNFEKPTTVLSDQNAAFEHGGVIRNFEYFGTVHGTAFSDRFVQGGDIFNAIYAGGGDDTIAPGLGVDTIFGGETPLDPSLETDADFLFLDFSIDETGNGVTTGTPLEGITVYQRDPVSFDNGFIGTAAFVAEIEYAHIIGTSEDDVILGIEDVFYDLQGDTLEGRDGDDVLTSYNGDDLLFGGAGSDTISAGADDDRIEAGRRGADDGIDRANGGAGADLFILGDEGGLHYGETVDGAAFSDRLVIEDFTPGVDRLQLTGAPEDYFTVPGGANTFILTAGVDARLIAVLNNVDAADFDLAAHVDYVEQSPGGLVAIPVGGFQAALKAESGEGSSFAIKTQTLVAGDGSTGDEFALAETAQSITTRANILTAATGDELFSLDLDIDQFVAPPPVEEDAFRVTEGLGSDFALGELITETFSNLGLGAITFGGFDTEREGDARAFGRFENGLGLDEGIVISTGKAVDLPGLNTEDGGLISHQFGGQTVELDFVNIGSLPTEGGGMTFYRADLSGIGFPIASLTLQDDDDGRGGDPGARSGADIAGVAITPLLVEDIAALTAGYVGAGLDGPVFVGEDGPSGSAAALQDEAILPRLDVFDFSASGTVFTPGEIRVVSLDQTSGDGGLVLSGGDPAIPEPAEAASRLAGDAGGFVDNGFATLGAFDFDGASGFVSTGDGGSLGFNLKAPLEAGQPAYLIVAEAGGAETFSARFTASSRPLTPPGDLSTDFGAVGAENDKARLVQEFLIAGDFPTDGDGVEVHLLDLVIASEELVEFAGTALQDRISVRINGENAIHLSDGDAATLDRLAASPSGPFHPDLIHNPDETAEDGPLATKADGYSTVIPVIGRLKQGVNRIEIEVADMRDGFLDTALLFSAVTSPVAPAAAAAPLASFTLTEGGAVRESLEPLDGMVGKLAYSIEAAPEFGDVRLAPDGTLSYAPKAGFSGADQLVYRVVDERGEARFGVVEFDVGKSRSPTTKSDDGRHDVSADSGGKLAIRSFAATAEADWMIGEQSADRMAAGDGDDSLAGRAGDDTMMGGAGADRMTGGAGSDFISGGLGQDMLLGGGGADRLIGRAGADTMRGGAGADEMSGGRGGDAMFGGKGRDWMSGGAGGDVIDGGVGNDIVKGGRGADEAHGGRGADSINGGAGADHISGGRGNDLLSGGSGRDVFHFTRGDGRDTLTDWRDGMDRIEIDRGADEFGDLSLSQHGDDVLIAFANVRVIVEDAEVAGFDAGDFVF